MKYVLVLENVISEDFKKESMSLFLSNLGIRYKVII